MVKRRTPEEADRELERVAPNTAAFLRRAKSAPTVIAQRAQDARADREFEQAREALAKVAPETAAIVEGWARLWRPADAC
jgi:hypothetical protein